MQGKRIVRHSMKGDPVEVALSLCPAYAADVAARILARRAFGKRGNVCSVARDPGYIDGKRLEYVATLGDGRSRHRVTLTVEA